MKIAVATDSYGVASHFGRCPKYTLVTISDGQVIAKKIIPNPGHEPGFLPRYLADLSVSCIIAGGMGQKAQQLFANQEIETVTGVSGSVDNAVSMYLTGGLTSQDNLCNHEEEGHGGECQHG